MLPFQLSSTQSTYTRKSRAVFIHRAPSSGNIYILYTPVLMISDGGPTIFDLFLTVEVCFSLLINNVSIIYYLYPLFSLYIRLYYI